MKVKVHIPYVDFDGNTGELVFDADLNALVLSTIGGRFDIAELSGMYVDSMPEEMKGETNHE